MNTRRELEDAEARIRMMEAAVVIAELGALFQLNPDCITPKSVKAEVLALYAWKKSALAVESEWNAQKVGELLGMPLGVSIRANIEPRIRELLKELAELKLLLQSPISSQQQACGGREVTENPTTIRIQ